MTDRDRLEICVQLERANETEALLDEPAHDASRPVDQPGMKVGLDRPDEHVHDGLGRLADSREYVRAKREAVRDARYLSSVDARERVASKAQVLHAPPPEVPERSPEGTLDALERGSDLVRAVRVHAPRDEARRLKVSYPRTRK